MTHEMPRVQGGFAPSGYGPPPASQQVQAEPAPTARAVQAVLLTRVDVPAPDGVRDVVLYALDDPSATFLAVGTDGVDHRYFKVGPQAPAPSGYGNPMGQVLGYNPALIGWNGSPAVEAIARQRRSADPLSGEWIEIGADEAVQLLSLSRWAPSHWPRHLREEVPS